MTSPKETQGELVERVARAIYATAPMFMSAGLSIETMQQVHWNKLQDDDRSEARDAATAAIAATLEGFRDWSQGGYPEPKWKDALERFVMSYANNNGISLKDPVITGPYKTISTEIDPDITLKDPAP